MKGKKCMVTGGLGFIGSKVVEKLAGEGVESIVIIDNIIVSDYSQDVSEPMFLATCVSEGIVKDGLDYIFHFASPCSVLQYNDNPIESLRETVEGFSNVLELAKMTEAKLIFPSSGNVYGYASPPHSELSRINPNNAYGMGKLICEKIADESDVDSVAVRLFTGYGEGEEKKGRLSSVICQFLQTIMRGENPVVWGDGEQRRDCIYIDDVARGFVDLAKNPDTPRVINLGTGKSYSYLEIIETISRVLKKNVIIEYVDKPSGYVDVAQADIHTMSRYIDLKPIDLEEGIKKFYDYLVREEDGRKNN